MFTLNCKGRLLVIDAPVVMGIINITPDSFYEGSRQLTEQDILVQAGKMITDGATMIDMGGVSTRPGSEQIDVANELQRVIPAIEAVSKKFPEVFISVDTYRAKVAEEAVNAGASIVNDISAGSLDEEMIGTVAKLKVPYVCMHMKGSPQTMQSLASYENITKEILDYFIHKIDACKKAGIHDVIIDPGFGFAKTIQHNFQLLKNLGVFKVLDKPLLLGISRKASIYKTLGITSKEALNGTTVLNTIGLHRGANILRVHDVKEAIEAIKLFSSVYKNDLF